MQKIDSMEKIVSIRTGKTANIAEKTVWSMEMKFSKAILGTILIGSSLPAIGFAQSGNYAAIPSDLPTPMAKPGQCYARKLVPAVYKNVPMNVVTQDAFEQVAVKDPVFETRNESIITKDAYKKYQVVDATFRTESATIVTQPAYEKLIAVPATFGVKNQTVIIREPKMVWRPGANLSGVKRLDSNTGEVYCLVEERGLTQTIAKKVVTSPAGVKKVVVPAQTQAITRQVLVSPAMVKEIDIPAEYRTLQVKSMVAPASEQRMIVPEMVSQVNRQEIVTPEHYVWVQVDCDHTGAQAMGVDFAQAKPVSTNTGGVVKVTTRDVQTKLAQMGLYHGPIDGIYGKMTTAAMAKFQAMKGLPSTGRADSTSLKALGF